VSNQSQKHRYIAIGLSVVVLFLFSKLRPRSQTHVILARDVSHSATKDEKFNKATENACTMAIEEAGSASSKLSVIKYADFAKNLSEVDISSYKKNEWACSDTAFEQNARGTSGLMAIQKTEEVLEKASRDYPNAAPLVIFALQADEIESPSDDRTVAEDDVSYQRAILAQSLISMANSIKAKGGQLIIIPGSYYDLEKDLRVRRDFPDNVGFCDVASAEDCPNEVKNRVAKQPKKNWIADLFGKHQSMDTRPLDSEGTVNK
jgi:hypothetical protein